MTEDNLDQYKQDLSALVAELQKANAEIVALKAENKKLKEALFKKN